MVVVSSGDAQVWISLKSSLEVDEETLAGDTSVLVGPTKQVRLLRGVRYLQTLVVLMREHTMVSRRTWDMALRGKGGYCWFVQQERSGQKHACVLPKLETTSVVVHFVSSEHPHLFCTPHGLGATCRALTYPCVLPNYVLYHYCWNFDHQIREAYDLWEIQRVPHKPGLRIWQRGTVVSSTEYTLATTSAAVASESQHQRYLRLRPRNAMVGSVYCPLSRISKHQTRGSGMLSTDAPAERLHFVGGFLT